MARQKFRIEKDSMGAVKVPMSAYYGAQTQRAIENFPISGIGFPSRFIRALAIVKFAAASVNEELRLLDPKIASVVRRAASEVMEGKLDKEFVVDIFQTGSGTSTNMNANEVIANRALEFLGKPRGGKEVHPNDHVNMGQSSNDVIPAAIHISALEAFQRDLLPALEGLHGALRKKSQEFDRIVKIGRTHLADATPIRLGQEFGGYARQIELNIHRIKGACSGLEELALGGTAVGTGINTHPEFPSHTVKKISDITKLNFRCAENAGCQPNKNRKRSSLVILWAPLRHRGDFSSGHTTRLLYHAGEGEPGHVRICASGCRACHGM